MKRLRFFKEHPFFALALTAVSSAVLLAAGFAIDASLEDSRAANATLIQSTPASDLVQRIVNRGDRTTPLFIAHAGGEIDGAQYTNSIESLKHSLDSGFEFVELDLRKTLSGDYFTAHSFKDFNQRTGKGWALLLPPLSAASVEKRRIDERFTPMLLADLAEHLHEAPPFVLVVDKAEDYETLLSDFPHPERMIVEVDSTDEYAEALREGVLTPALATRSFKEAISAGVHAVVTRPSSLRNDPEGAEAFRRSGGIILTATIEDCRDALADPVVGTLSDLVYVDRCTRSAL